MTPDSMARADAVSMVTHRPMHEVVLMSAGDAAEELRAAGASLQDLLCALEPPECAEYQL